MLSLPHPLRTKVFNEYFVLESLLADLPELYKNMADKIEARAKREAELAAGGDDDIYQTVYHSFDSSVEFANSVPDQSRGYILTAIYAFYERNVKLVFRELGLPNYQKEKMSVQNVFKKCNLRITSIQQIYDDIEILGLIRNNLSHGELNNVNHWKKLKAYVNGCPYLEMEEDIVHINNNYILMQFLATIVSFFEAVFSINPIFETKHIGNCRIC